MDKIYQEVKKGKYLFNSGQVRDLTKIDLSNGYSLIIAVDSDGGIGSRPGDTVKCNDYLLGRLSMRVPLMEILGSGSLPLAAFNVLTFPMDVHAKEIIRGIREELSDAGLGRDFPLSGSTEDNVITRETGLGTMVVGIVHKDDFRPGSSLPDDNVLCVGIPKSAPEDELSIDDTEILKWHHLRKILNQSNVHDLLPVGSKGVLYEAHNMAETAKLKFLANSNSVFDFYKSAGPSTCIILSCTGKFEKTLQKMLDVPIINVGRLNQN
ncbi:hypothetical protein ACFLSX_05500 [Calditrichota bacterium]